MYCEEGYNLKGETCYKETKEKLYRKQTRTKENKKIDIIWSKNNDQELLDKEYTITRKVTCEF